MCMCTQTLYINMQNRGEGPTQSLRINIHILPFIGEMDLLSTITTTNSGWSQEIP